MPKKAKPVLKAVPKEFLRRNKPLAKVISLLVWVTGILVALSVGFGMVDGNLKIRFMPLEVTLIAGWIVIVLTIIGIIMEIIDLLS